MPTEIHPTAVIDPSAELGEDVVVGPYCVVHAGVKLGDRCWLQNHVTLAGPSEFGPDNRFFAYGSVGQQTQDLKYTGEPTYLRVGEGNTFREFVTVHRATAPETETVIGNFGNFLSYCHVAHDCIVGDHVIFSNNATLGGHVIVEDYAILGGFSGIHQFCRIGAHAITGGCTKVVQDVPPYMVADGNPVRIRAVNSVGLSRRGFSEDSVKSIKQALRIIFREDRNTSEAVDHLASLEDRTPEIDTIVDFIRASKRGIS
ncbi:MAG: acyl-ACP--UDP-N-acetylglucosamine O-acyltransferase [Verrucomicrobiota bacterium]